MPRAGALSQRSIILCIIQTALSHLSIPRHPETRVNLNLAHHPRTRKCAHQSSRAAAATLATLLVCAQLSCGGGSSDSGGGGTPQRTFTTIDVEGAGAATGQGTYIEAINDAGDVAGYFMDSNSLTHGFVRSAAGVITTFDVPASNGESTVAQGIDSAGDVVGDYNAPNTGAHSFIRTADGTITTFDPTFSGNSAALSINDSGVITGAILGPVTGSGYLYTLNGTFTSFDPTGNAAQVLSVFPYRINASGAVAGDYIDLGGVYHGFTRDAAGTITILDAPGAGTAAQEGTEIDDLNASGTVVGGISVGLVGGVNATHSVMHTADGTYTVFDPPQAAGVSSFAYGINDSGTIIGTYRGTDLIRHAYLLQPNGTYVSFDDPLAQQGPLTTDDIGTVPRRINANGAVAGFYSDTNGVRHGFIWQ